MAAGRRPARGRRPAPGGRLGAGGSARRGPRALGRREVPIHVEAVRRQVEGDGGGRPVRDGDLRVEVRVIHLDRQLGAGALRPPIGARSAAHQGLVLGGRCSTQGQDAARRGSEPAACRGRCPAVASLPGRRDRALTSRSTRPAERICVPLRVRGAIGSGRTPAWRRRENDSAPRSHDSPPPRGELEVGMAACIEPPGFAVTSPRRHALRLGGGSGGAIHAGVDPDIHCASPETLASTRRRATDCVRNHPYVPG